MEINKITETARPSLPANCVPIIGHTTKWLTVAALSPIAVSDRSMPSMSAFGVAVRTEAVLTESQAVLQQPANSRGGSPPRGRQA
ncbi:MAG: hypothetical protein H0T78_08090 [Longispora sp.]|nr:hypothetical protein [Longispora sp. (in: high G+C Gram-positive bacteria)]